MLTVASLRTLEEGCRRRCCDGLAGSEAQGKRSPPDSSAFCGWGGSCPARQGLRRRKQVGDLSLSRTRSALLSLQWAICKLGGLLGRLATQAHSRGKARKTAFRKKTHCVKHVAGKLQLCLFQGNQRWTAAAEPMRSLAALPRGPCRGGCPRGLTKTRGVERGKERDGKELRDIRSARYVRSRISHRFCSVFPGKLSTYFSVQTSAGQTKRPVLRRRGVY